jgi:hypothetical protein
VFLLLVTVAVTAILRPVRTMFPDRFPTSNKGSIEAFCDYESAIKVKWHLAQVLRYQSTSPGLGLSTKRTELNRQHEEVPAKRKPKSWVTEIKLIP